MAESHPPVDGSVKRRNRKSGSNDDKEELGRFAHRLSLDVTSDALALASHNGTIPSSTSHGDCSTSHVHCSTSQGPCSTSSGTCSGTTCSTSQGPCSTSSGTCSTSNYQTVEAPPTSSSTSTSTDRPQSLPNTPGGSGSRLTEAPSFEDCHKHHQHHHHHRNPVGRIRDVSRTLVKWLRFKSKSINSLNERGEADPPWRPWRKSCKGGKPLTRISFDLLLY